MNIHKLFALSSRAFLFFLGQYAVPQMVAAKRIVRFGVIYHSKNQNKPYVEAAKLFKNEVELGTGQELPVDLVDIKELGETISQRTRTALLQVEQGRMGMCEVQTG